MNIINKKSGTGTRKIFWAPGSKGMSVFLALMIVTTVLVLATITLRTSSDDLDISAHEADSLQAYLAAESGVWHAMTFLRNDQNYAGRFSDTIEVAIGADESLDDELRYSNYYVEVVRQGASGPPSHIVSRGVYRGKQRTLWVKIKSLSPLSVDRPRETGYR